MFIYYLIAFLSCLSISFLIIGLSIKSERQIVKDRMAKRKTIIPGQPSQYSVEVEMSLPFKERVLIPFLSKLARLAGRVSPSGSTQLIEKKLITAGHPYGIGSREFLGIRVISCIGFILLGIIAAKFMGTPLMKLLAAAGAMFAGIYLPGYWLQQVTNARQLTIRKVLPEMLDLLTVSVEAGLGLDGAMQKVVEKMRNPLADEMNRALQEMRVGKTRVEALRDMSERVDVSELTSFVASICQADQLGGSISKVLKVQSDTLRKRRIQRARDLAATLPVKMLFPMVFFIFPAIFVVVLAPGALQIIKSMK